MTDIALAWDNALFAADLAIEGGRLVTDDGLRTAILISLFTDARANDDDPLPEPGADRRGWWGDASQDHYRIGCGVLVRSGRFNCRWLIAGRENDPVIGALVSRSARRVP